MITQNDSVPVKLYQYYILKHLLIFSSDEKANVKIIIPNIARLDSNSLMVDFVNEDGQSIKTLAVMDEMASFDLPTNNPFRIRLSGKTRNGESFQRVSRKEVKPQYAFIRTQFQQDLLTIKRGSRSSFRAAIDYSGGGSKEFDVKAAVFPSNVKVEVENRIIVKSGRSGYVSVYLDTPASTPVGTVVKVHIFATGGQTKLRLLANVMVV